MQCTLDENYNYVVAKPLCSADFLVCWYSLMDKVAFALNHLYLLRSGPSPLCFLRCYTQFQLCFLAVPHRCFTHMGTGLLKWLSFCPWTASFSETGHQQCDPSMFQKAPAFFPVCTYSFHTSKMRNFPNDFLVNQLHVVLLIAPSQCVFQEQCQPAVDIVRSHNRGFPLDDMTFRGRDIKDLEWVLTWASPSRMLH